MRGIALCAALLALAAGCGRPDTEAEGVLTVAAAANLTEAFNELGREFTQATGTPVVFSYAATTMLAQQIENWAPFDVFASADTGHLDRLVASGRIVAESRAVYARGRLALWVPRADPESAAGLERLLDPGVRFIAIANPSVAPYGAAAVEALQRAGLWERLEPKVVYANNINQAKQFAASGNAEAAFTASSLVLDVRGKVLVVDESLHSPLDQALGIVTASPKQEAARRFTGFALGEPGRSILSRYGYALPRQGD